MGLLEAMAAKKTIFCIGISLPKVEGLNCVQINSDQSLLDADIVAFRPAIINNSYYAETYNGKPRLSDHDSFVMQDKISHWNTQLRAAYEAGKTILVFLPEKQEAYRYTGERNYSGTGRSRVTTNIVTLVSNYDLLPVKLESLVFGEGKGMKLASGGEVLSQYWREFGPVSKYYAHFAAQKLKPLILTKTGDKLVGALVSGVGRVVILPDIEWNPKNFTQEKDGKDYWTSDAQNFSIRIRDTIFDLDAEFKQKLAATPPPQWTSSTAFRLKVEATIEAEILEVSRKIESLSSEREEKRRNLERQLSLRSLLFEKGIPLEAAVREALAVLGFDVSSFRQGESEFDAVFSSAEGRFLGEVEGKDAKAVNIDKLSQLERNVSEDFARDEVAEAATGVLFGNAFRLMPPDEREDFFTQKVLSGAQRSRVALVRTTDLFIAARYVRESGDNDFSAACRRAIAEGAGGIVSFPDAGGSAQDALK